MPRDAMPSLHPALLPRGTAVGPWRVLGWVSRGVHGAVYRAERIGQEHLPPVALKVALLPEDPRAPREQELLSRSLHPHIPRLVDHGFWLSPSGARHPFVAMEWIDGVPLYDWARMFRPSAAQQLRLLSQAAFALHYLHVQGALHRDLKGGNLLVRRFDNRLFVTDFGSGIYPDADSLTPQQLPPGTPAYRSPEAWLFSQRFRLSSERYRAAPADDVYALGVTACVLATGKYPEMGELRKDEHGTWYLDSLMLPRALFSARVEPPLRDMILRMLAIRPEERITAAELVPALERAADSLRTPPSPQALTAGALFTWAVRVALVLLLTAPGHSQPRQGAELLAARASSSEAEPVGLGETGASASPASRPPSSSPPVAADTPPEPSEGQVQPDKKGRCLHPRQVILNGACWARVSREECDVLLGHMYQGACYVPVFSPGSSKRPNTSGDKGPH